MADLYGELNNSINFELQKKLNSIKRVFDVEDHEKGVYRRNPKCWAYNYNIEAVSPWNSDSNHRKAGVLVTPIHIIFARHFPITVGATVRFVTRNNQVVDRKVVSNKYIPGDIALGTLDFPITEIDPVYIFPDNIEDYFINGSMNNVLTICFDQEEKALAGEIKDYTEEGRIYLKAPSNPHFSIFYENKITGDSGSPVFVILNGRPVLLMTLTYGGAGSGYSINKRSHLINNAIKDSGYDEKLREIDLSYFNVWKEEGKPIEEDVEWINLKGVDVLNINSDKFLRKITSNDWNSGAFSSQKIPANQNGGVEFLANDTTKYLMFGLSQIDKDAGFQNINHAVHLRPNNLFWIYENGVKKNYQGTYQINDRFSVIKTGNVIDYFKNGTKVFSTSGSPARDLHADCSIYNFYGTIKNPKIFVHSGTF